MKCPNSNCSEILYSEKWRCPTCNTIYPESSTSRQNFIIDCKNRLSNLSWTIEPPKSNIQYYGLDFIAYKNDSLLGMLTLGVKCIYTQVPIPKRSMDDIIKSLPQNPNEIGAHKILLLITTVQASIIDSFKSDNNYFVISPDHIPMMKPNIFRNSDHILINPIVFRKRQFNLYDKKLYVLMPFTESWSSDVWDEFIQEATNIAGWQCERADNASGQIIIEDIWDGINSSKCVLADITGCNSNVLYELGIAHTLGKEVILTVQKKSTKIPFDIYGYRRIEYEFSFKGKTKFIENLKNKLNAL